MPSEMTFRRTFGSWASALNAAGFTPIKYNPCTHGQKRKGTRNKTRKVIDVRGYDFIFEPAHPLAKKSGYVAVHRQVAYDAGLLVDRNDDVHHKNRNKKDNRIENLQPLSRSAHAQISTPKGTKRPRKVSSACIASNCGELTGSKYQLCTKHYKSEWSKAKKSAKRLEVIGNIFEGESK